MSEPVGSARVGLNAAALVGARVFGLALSLAQSAIIFRALGVEQTGHFGFALGFTALFSVFATLGIQRLLVRDIARAPELAWDYVWPALWIVSALSAVVMAAIAITVHAIEDDPAARAAVLAAAASVIVLWALQQPFESLLRARERMVLLAAITTGVAILKLLSVALALAAWESHARGAAVAHAAIGIANTAGFIVCTGFAVRVAGWSRPRLNLAFMLPRLAECLPYTLSMLFSLLYFKADMTILQVLEGEAGTGPYTPAQRVMEPLLMVAGLWGTAVFPALCRLSHTDASQYAQLKTTSLRLALLAACPMAVGLAILARPVVALLTGDVAAFALTVTMMQVLAAVIPLFYLNSIGQEFFYAAHRNWFVTTTYALAALVAVAGNFLLIPVWGPIAVAWVAIASNALISALFIYGLHQELGGMQLPTLLVKTALACAIMALAAWLAAPLGLLLAVALGAGAYALLIVLLKTLNPEERSMFREMLRPLARRAHG